MSWTNTSGWDYTLNRIFRNEDFDSGLKYKKTPAKTFLGDKNYMFKTKIHNLSNYNQSSGYFKLSSPWSQSLEIKNQLMSSYVKLQSTDDDYIYFYSKPNNNITTDELITYNSTSGFTASYGILKAEIFEIEWTLNGYSWIGNDNFISLPSANPPLGEGNPIRNRGNGWSYDTVSESYFWFDTEGTVLDDGEPVQICLEYPPLTSPASINGQIEGSEATGCGYFISPFKEINHMSKFIDYQFFNFEFYLEKYTFSRNDENAGVKVYLSDIEPYTGILENEFNDYLDNCELLISKNTTGTYSFYGLSGNRYLFIVGDPASATFSANTQLKISNIKIEGGYHSSNNEIYNAIINNDISFDPSDFIGATYSTFAGSGNSVDNNIIGVTLSSKLGNGTFKAGIWENGTWNSGWRKDEDVKELYDIIRSIKIKSDSKWRIRISGLSEDINDLNIGEYISIGNIIAIDINENRNTLKDYYRIINKAEIDNRLSYIEVDINVIFPMRRIEKDSEFHRIKVTRNIWSSGVFLNGYFEGIWNNGLFKGYPLITEMNNSNWIDGNFDGGHFESNYYISGSFSQTFRDASNIPAKLGLSFSTAHNIKVGDVIEITMATQSINFNRYNGETTVIKVLDDFQFVTDRNYGLFDNETGEFTTEIKTGIIQNMKFNSNNVSSITSVDSLVSSTVFVYNSWVDVVYDNDSAVNIGKPQNILDSISKKKYSENNLYGYPTNDVLSSTSKFRDSYSNTERTYTLGNKYKIFEDYVGDSSRFTEYFGPTGPDSELLTRQGWTYSKQNIDSITFSRSESLGESSILGEELRVDSTFKGGVLDISEPLIPVNRSKIELTKNKYSVVEFDLVKSKINLAVNEDYGIISDAFYNLVPTIGSKVSASFSEPDSIYESTGLSASLDEVSSGNFRIRKEPLVHFNNLNVIKREFTEGTQSVSNIYELESTFLPIYENVNHVATKRSKKIEYFYNKRNLSMNFRGNGFFGELPSGYIVNNLKLYEVDMIPFFQYFTDININKSVQTPLQGISPYIVFNKKNSVIINKSSIGFKSFDIMQSNTYLLPTIDDLLSDD